MSWGWLILAAWLGFMAGYILCGILTWDAEADFD